MVLQFFGRKKIARLHEKFALVLEGDDGNDGLFVHLFDGDSRLVSRQIYLIFENGRTTLIMVISVVQSY